ncbi:putative bifunctional diguanylate cyclase/phosphodiesterase [Sphaerotilus mobilis]|uniref:Diguanylate cyclase (GGDEF)-like protein n=1 Tax=Sphaerotilus mobilis TaxID=47994 RepID=A0A4Q7LTU6_9BURK|nr:EAL domain-containing protein [Sphaerotilus mobilis]RZS57249.1 diguanylate cyclase (GGDEF)-like protein [Sphaerotilus mobilis]
MFFNNHFSSSAIAEVRQPRILLVDDDEVSLMLTAAALRERGFAVTEANHGDRALRLLGDWTPDLIVLDALMPGRDGFDTCIELRGLPGFELMPVLMLTGLDDDASIERAYEAGATDFFVKSTQWSLLAGRLRYLLRTSRIHLELLRSRAKLARAQDLARMGSFEWHGNATGLVLEAEALRVFGRGPQETLSLGQLLRALVGEERAGFCALLREVVRHSTVIDTDVRIVMPDHRQRVVHIEAEPEFDEQGNLVGYTGVVQDVTDRRMIEDRIRHLANFDPLTGMPNRRQLILRAERMLEHARRQGHDSALLLIDLDRFKNINDTLGHGSGDELLVAMSRRLRRCVDYHDKLSDTDVDAGMQRSHLGLETVGRHGGDEFVVLLPEVPHEAAALAVGQKVLDALRQPVLLGGREYFVTGSVGLAMFPRDGISVVDLMRHADLAMYSVKGSGRNAMAVYQAQMGGRNREKLELESALHKALERGELVLHYQPKVEVGRDAEGRSVVIRVIGVEALMRWQRAGVLVPPAEFIPLAEETGLIVPMSDWALREAARQIRRWRDHDGLALTVAVNLPSRSFERGDVLDLIHSAAAAHDVPLSSLVLEITETGLMKGIDEVTPMLHRLNQHGVGLSIDDFGTGYSSLSYLTQLPISELKIDRSFVHRLDQSGGNSAVVTAIVALAGGLGLKLVAEGVENEAQRDVLLRLGCHTMQGFLYALPMPADEVVNWVRQQRL